MADKLYSELNAAAALSASDVVTVQQGGVEILQTTLGALRTFIGAGGGSKTYAVLTPLDNQPPTASFATLDTRNSIAVLDFDDTASEAAVFAQVMSEAAALGSGLKIRIHWMATAAVTGNVVWGAQIERSNTDLDADSFDTAATTTGSANASSGIVTVTEILLTTIDSVTAGDLYRLKVYRDAANGSDTMVGDAELVAVEIRSAT